MTRTPQLLGALRRRILLVLAANQTRYGYTVEAVAEKLIRFGFHEVADMVAEVLRQLETEGKAVSVIQESDQTAVYFATDAGRAIAAASA